MNREVLEMTFFFQNNEAIFQQKNECDEYKL